jgi:hypothetical protein
VHTILEVSHFEVETYPKPKKDLEHTRHVSTRVDGSIAMNGQTFNSRAFPNAFSDVDTRMSDPRSKACARCCCQLHIFAFRATTTTSAHRPHSGVSWGSLALFQRDFFGLYLEARSAYKYACL